MTADEGGPDAEDPAAPAAAGTRARLGTHTRRNLVLVGVCTGLLIVAGVSLYATESGGNSVTGPPLVDRTNRSAPPFELPLLGSASRTVTLTQFRGEDLVVNFWASWCDPCETEMPLLESSYESRRPTVQFVGIDTNDTATSARAFLSKVKVTYPVLFDPGGDEVAAKYGLFGLPTTVFISSRGTIEGFHYGQLSRSTLDEALHEAFGT